MLSPEMNHSVAPSGHNFAEAMLLRGHAPPGFPPSPFAAAATMDHQRVSCRYLMSTKLTSFYYIVALNMIWIITMTLITRLL